MKKTLLFIFITLFFTVCSPAYADRYWGLGAGPSSFDIKPLFGSDEVDDTTAIRFLYGSRNNNTGFELDMSYAEYNWTFDSASSHSVLNIILSGAAYMPINETFSLFGKIGINFWSTTVNFSGSSYEGDSSIGLAASAGLDFAVSESFHLTAEYQVLPGLSDGIDDGDISQFMFNALYYY